MNNYKRLLELSKHNELNDVDIYNFGETAESEDAVKTLRCIRTFQQSSDDIINDFLRVYNE